MLLGDAAHAMVPSHGQGMNACFEDYFELDRLLATTRDWSGACDEFERVRRELSFELQRRFPDRFIPRYSMVMFHHEIPCSVACERGTVQARILEDPTASAEATRAPG